MGGRGGYQTLRWGGRGGPPPRAHPQISDVSDQVVPDFSIAQETILVNRNSRKLQGASFRDMTLKELGGWQLQAFQGVCC